MFLVGWLKKTYKKCNQAYYTLIKENFINFARANNRFDSKL